MVTERSTTGVPGAAPSLRAPVVVPAGGHRIQLSTRTAGSFAFGLGGLLVVAALFASASWSWLLWIAVGLAAGAVAGRFGLVWLTVPIVLGFYPASLALGLMASLAPFWWLGALVGIGLVGAGFVAGTAIEVRPSPGAGIRAWWSGVPRVGRRLLAGIVALSLVGIAGYTVAAGAIGSEEFVHPARHNTDCRTPGTRFGWAYEAINYDKADDLRLAAANPDMTDCASQGTAAGDEVVSSDGIHLAGWYIPAASGIGSGGPTVVIVHGWKSNKSEVLKYAVPFHDAFNLVLLDQRNSGRSTTADTTMGVWEQLDVRAMVDWLTRTKQPRWIGLMGNSMGGAAALAEAVSDPRIGALILDSMHAQMVVSGGYIVETEYGLPSVPTSWAIAVGASLRIGADVTQVDPVRTITKLGTRPVLLLHGTLDVIDRPADSVEQNFHAALAAGVPVELHYCQGGTHGLVIDRCPTEWARWATWFFTNAAG